MVGMNTVTVSAAVSAVVTVIIGTLLNWGERVVTWIRRKVPPDHVALSTGGGWANQATAVPDQVRVTVCCAPNRSLGLKVIDPGAAVNFVRERFQGMFPDEPAFSMPPYGVRFEATGGAQEGSAFVHVSGRVDLSINVLTTPSTHPPITLTLLDVIWPVLLMREAVKSQAYERVFGRRTRGLRRRFDWAIAVGTSVTVAGQGSVSWQDLRFPGQRPPRAGKEQQAFCPARGYAAPELRNWKPRRPATDLVSLFLTDFLQQNGFHDVALAVTDTLQALESRDETSHTASFLS